MKIIHVYDLDKDDIDACEVCPNDEKGFTDSSKYVHLQLFKGFNIWLSLCHTHFKRLEKKSKSKEKKT